MEDRGIRKYFSFWGEGKFCVLEFISFYGTCVHEREREERE